MVNFFPDAGKPFISTEPCDLHEITNCSTCSGLDKKLAKEDAEADLGPTSPMSWSSLAAAVVEPGEVIAKWSGNCAWCGRRYEAGETIKFSQKHDGWVTVMGCS